MCLSSTRGEVNVASITARDLHAHFCERTGQRLTLSYQREMTWAQFVQRGLTREDLDLVIRWTQLQIQRGEGGFSPLSLQLHNMLGDLDRFEDRLGVASKSKLAKALARPASPNSRPPTLDTPEPVSIEQGRAIAAQLRQFREQQTRGESHHDASPAPSSP